MSDRPIEYVRLTPEFERPENFRRGLDVTLPEELEIPEFEKITFEEFKLIEDWECDNIREEIQEKYIFLLMKKHENLWNGKNIRVSKEAWQRLAYDFYLRTKIVIDIEDIRYLWHRSHTRLRRGLARSIVGGDNEYGTEVTLLEKVPMYPYLRFFRPVLLEYETALRQKQTGLPYDQRALDDVQAFNSELDEEIEENRQNRRTNRRLTRENERRAAASGAAYNEPSSSEVKPFDFTGVFGQFRQMRDPMEKLPREDEERYAASYDSRNSHRSALDLIQDGEMIVGGNEEVYGNEANGSEQMGYDDDGEPLPTFLKTRPPHPPELRELTYQTTDFNIQLHTAELEEEGEEVDEETKIALHALFTELNRFQDGSMYSFSEIFKGAAEIARKTEQEREQGTSGAPPGPAPGPAPEATPGSPPGAPTGAPPGEQPGAPIGAPPGAPSGQ